MKIKGDKKQGNNQKQENKKVSIDMQELKNTIINYIVPLVSLVLVLLIGAFVLYPSYKELPNLQTELETKKALETNLNNKLNNLNRLVDYQSAVNENSDLVNKVMVSEQLVPGLLTQVDSIVRTSGLTLNRLTYGSGKSLGSGSAQEDSAEYSTVVINLGAEGTFGQMVTFLESLENAARLINVGEFRYSTSNTDDEGIYSINFVLYSPYLYVESNAVTDEPIDLNISDPEFISLINRLKKLKYYDPEFIDETVPVVEEVEEEEGSTEEATEAEVEQPAEVTDTATEETPSEESSEDSIFPS